jgi:uncharacterized protein YybS (DUF2232 family)
MAKDIVNGVFITSLIFFISVFIPIIGFVGALFIPLPVLYYRIKLGRTVGAVVPIATGIIQLLVVGGISTDTLFFAELLLIGFLLGELLTLNLSIEKTIVIATAAVLLSGMLSLFGLSILSGKSVSTIVSEYVAKNLELTMALYQSMGMTAENIRLISQALEQIHRALVRIMPALVTASTLFVVWINILLARPLLRSRSLFCPDYGPLNMWKAPETLVWVVIGCALAMFIPAGALKIIGLNGLLILMMVYFFQGIAIVAFYFEKKRFPRFVRLFLYTLIAVQQLVLLIVIGLGFFDMWVNFRRWGTSSYK